MIRSQILLTPTIGREIEKLASSQGLSRSAVVRKLLGQALGYETNGQSKTKKPKNNLEILDLASFTEKNPRINGFREIFSVGGKTTEIKVLPDAVFRYFETHNKFPTELGYQILKICHELENLSETKRLVVRRAYFVPGLDNPPGPRFLGLKPEEVVDAIIEIYQFAQEHEYHLKKGSQICTFFYPFYDPKPVSLPIKKDTEIPYGGYTAPLNKESTRVEVFACWGNNEGVQSFDSIDRYVVDTKRKIILSKDIPQKTSMFCTTQNSQSEKLVVPLDKQFEQILSDSEILETARVVRELSKRYGLRRVEFSYDGKESIIFNESVPYQICDKEVKNLDKRGFIKTVSSENDVEKLRKLKEKDVTKTIVYINRSIVENRAYDTLNSIAGLPKKFIIFYPGLSATAHAMRVLNDFGHTAITVGNRKFKNGDEVIIRIRENQIFIDLVSKSRVGNYLVNLHDARLYGNNIVGGKALNLSLLKSKGFKIPHGTVLTTTFFDKVTHLKQRDMEIPKSLWREVEQSADWKKDKKYAVRSSANVEDQAKHSFAGQFKTFLNVGVGEIKEKVAEVIKSSFDSKIYKYCNALGKPLVVKMAVIVQEMVDVEKSGVVFGKDIQTGNTDNIIIDTAYGLGEGVVEGTAKTQRLIYSRAKDQLINENAGSERKILSRIEIDSLIEMTLSIESLMREAQDIEWAIDQKGQIWLVQTRSLN